MEEIDKLCLKITTLQQDAERAFVEEKRIRALFLQLAKELDEKKEEIRLLNLSIDFAQKSLVELNLS